MISPTRENPFAAIDATLTRFFHDVRPVGSGQHAVFPVTAELVNDRAATESRARASEFPAA